MLAGLLLIVQLFTRASAELDPLELSLVLEAVADSVRSMCREAAPAALGNFDAFGRFAPARRGRRLKPLLPERSKRCRYFVAASLAAGL